MRAKLKKFCSTVVLHSPTWIHVITQGEIDFILLTLHSIMEIPKRLQCNLTNVINIGRIQTYVSVLSTEELTRHVKQGREKWRAMFHTCIKFFTPTSMYVYITYVVVRDPRHTLIKSHRSKTGIIYMQSWKQCDLPIITWWAKLQRYIMRRRLDLPYSHCGSR